MSDSRPVSSSHRPHQLADNQVNNELNVRCCLLVCVSVFVINQQEIFTDEKPESTI